MKHETELKAVETVAEPLIITEVVFTPAPKLTALVNIRRKLAQRARRLITEQRERFYDPCCTAHRSNFLNGR